jgi:cytochrome b involved in lipid metabolism
VWDITEFIPQHPGGSASLSYACLCYAVKIKGGRLLIR